jgi:hypothetical protein
LSFSFTRQKGRSRAWVPVSHILPEADLDPGDAMQTKCMPSIRAKRLCRRRALPNEALSPSRRKNDKTGLTASGSSKAAAAVNGLEGPSDKVMATVSRIGADDRHGDVEVQRHEEMCQPQE